MKKIYIAITIFSFVFLSGCTLPNLYDVQLPDTQNESNDITGTIPIAEFTSNNINIEIHGKNVICTNTYSSEENIMYAWYVIQAKDGSPILKSNYSKSNSFTYEPEISGSYQIIAYIRYPDSSRIFVKTQTFSYDSEYDRILVEENATDISAFTSESFEVKISQNTIFLENKFSASDILYAWYVIDLNSNLPIVKENYSESNVYKYEVLSRGNYKIEAFIKFNNGERKSVPAIEFSYDGIKIKTLHK